MVYGKSPRKESNTAALCDCFVRGAEENGNSIVRMFIREHKIAGCLEGGACHRNGGFCVRQDGMKKVYAAVLTI